MAKSQINAAASWYGLFRSHCIIRRTHCSAVTQDAFNNFCGELPMQSNFFQTLDTTISNKLFPCLKDHQMRSRKRSRCDITPQCLLIEKVHGVWGARALFRRTDCAGGWRPAAGGAERRFGYFRCSSALSASSLEPAKKRLTRSATELAQGAIGSTSSTATRTPLRSKDHQCARWR